MAGHPPIASRSARPGRAAFSLLETAIALGILGVGLIMVAAVFPVALTQHRRVAEQADATRLAPKPEALIKGRINVADLSWDPNLTVTGEDSPFYLLPTMNLEVGGSDWNLVAIPGVGAYANVMNGPWSVNLGFFGAMDILSDRIALFSSGQPDAPFTDAEFNHEPGRTTWVAFYRRLSNGHVQFAVALSHVRRFQRYVPQDATYDDDAGAFPADVGADGPIYRLTVPWRVQVSRAIDPANTGRNLLAGIIGNEGLDELAPLGAQIMIRGRDSGTPSLGTGPPANVPAGRILTTIDTPASNIIEVREDLSGIRIGQPFDVWILPPALTGGGAGNAEFDTESPVLEWKLFL